MTERSRHLVEWLLTCSLAGWLGAMLFFAIAVAPAAFEVVAEPGLVGRFVGRLLAVLHLGGALVFLFASALATALGRSKLLRLAPILLAALCLASHFGVSRPLTELRRVPAQERTAEDRQRFARLHGLSVGIYAVIGLGTATLLYRRETERFG